MSFERSSRQRNSRYKGPEQGRDGWRHSQWGEKVLGGKFP